MNNNNIDKIIHSLSSVRMSEVEKNAMRNTLLDFSYTTAAKSIPSPYVFRFSHLRTSLSFALVLFLVVGSISKPVSASALPGELLYSVKMMHEEIEGMTKTSPQQKVDFEISRTQKRIAEATVLVETKSLDAEQETAIAERIKKHTTKARNEIQEVKSKDAVKALELNLELETSLRSNAETLRKVMDESDTTILTVLDEEPKEEKDSEKEEVIIATDISTDEAETETTIALTEINELDITLDDTQPIVLKEARESTEENTRLLVTSIEDDIKEIEEVTRQAKVEVASRIVAPQSLGLEVSTDLLLKQ